MKTFSLRKILGITREQTPIDPVRFGDPLALQIQWTPATRGGRSFRTHKLVQIDISRVEFKPAILAKVFFSIFILIGLGLMVAFWATNATAPHSMAETLMPILIVGAFLIIGIVLFYAGTSPIVFDKGMGYFWKGRKSPQDVVEVASLKKCVPLDQIHALQLVSEYVRTGKGSFYSYELNLVMEDARRMTVIDHGDLPKLRADAKNLAEFLGRPVWDAINR